MFYDIFMAPLEALFLRKIRKNLVSQASGSLLEIGFGTGVNVPFYPKDLSTLTALDIVIDPRIAAKYQEIDFVLGTAEALPFNDHSFDTVLATLTLCSVGDIELVLQEINRVLKPGGQYLFIEHILPESRRWASFFKFLNPHWLACSKSCQLIHQTDQIIARSSLDIIQENKSAHTILWSGKAVKV